MVASSSCQTQLRGSDFRTRWAVAEVHPGIGRPGGRAARNVIRDDARLLDDVAPVLPTAAIGKGERSPIHAIRKRVNFSPEIAWW